MEMTKQLFREFWIPLFSALLWSIYNINGWANFTIASFIAKFSAAFFFTSWLCSQYFRVRKQTKVDNSLQTIQNTAEAVIKNLEKKTEDLIGYATGGESFCYLVLGSLNHDTGRGAITVIHQGKHPLYDVTANIVDLEKLEALKENITFDHLKEGHRMYGNMIPGFCSIKNERLDLGGAKERSFNIFWTARNGGFEQLLRYKKINGRWYMATKVIRGNILLFEKIDPDYPRTELGEINW